VIEKNRDLIVGVKVRAYTGLSSTVCLQRARELADQVRLPIMVHIAPPPPEFDEIVPFLKEGDIITHPYHGGEKTLLNDRNEIRPEYWEVRRRGIEVDLGLDRFHGDLNVMRIALEQGFEPDFISSDLAMTNLHSITFDLPTTVSKVIAAGLPLPDALAKCTLGPACKLGREDEIGDLREGALADVAIFEVAKDDHVFDDFFGNRLPARERLIPHLTIRQGEILEPVTRTTETLDCLRRTNPWPQRDG
jgi:dihydroorotase